MILDVIAYDDRRIALKRIELDFLALIIEHTPTCEDHYYFPFSCFRRWTGYDEEVVGGILRSMKKRQLVQYGTGFTEDGLIGGAGYSITSKGRSYYSLMSKEAS